MELGQLRKFVAAKPFKPFEIRLVDGRTFEIPHPEFCMIPPNMRHTVFVAQPGDEAVDVIDTMMIASVRTRENGAGGVGSVVGGGDGA